MSPHTPFLTRRAITQLTLDTEPYLSCDDCFEAVDEAVDELVLRLGSLTPRLRTHLWGCSACLEEARMLAELVAHEAGLDPVTGRDRIGHALDMPERAR